MKRHFWITVLVLVLIVVSVVALQFSWFPGDITNILESGLSRAGALASVIAVIVALAVFSRQTQQMGEIQKIAGSIDRKLFGELPNPTAVYNTIVEALREAENDPTSEVSVMFYWLWFGTDLTGDPRTPVLDPAKWNSLTSEVAVLLRKRITSGLMTNLVLMDVKSNGFKEFVSALIEYTEKQLCASTGYLAKTGDKPRDLEKITARIIEAYTAEIEWLEREVARHETAVCYQMDVPALIFACSGERIRRGTYYFGETPFLQDKLTVGGFGTDSPQMVKMLESHVKARTGSTTQNDAPQP